MLWGVCPLPKDYSGGRSFSKYLNFVLICASASWGKCLQNYLSGLGFSELTWPSLASQSQQTSVLYCVYEKHQIVSWRGLSRGSLLELCLHEKVHVSTSLFLAVKSRAFLVSNLAVPDHSLPIKALRFLLESEAFVAWGLEQNLCCVVVVFGFLSEVTPTVLPRCFSSIIFSQSLINFQAQISTSPKCWYQIGCFLFRACFLVSSQSCWAVTGYLLGLSTG